MIEAPCVNGHRIVTIDILQIKTNYIFRQKDGWLMQCLGIIWNRPYLKIRGAIISVHWASWFMCMDHCIKQGQAGQLDIRTYVKYVIYARKARAVRRNKYNFDRKSWFARYCKTEKPGRLWQCVVGHQLIGLITIKLEYTYTEPINSVGT